MHKQDYLLNIPNYENDLIFYKVMNYPIPTNSQYFLFEKKVDDLLPASNFQLSTFSWYRKNDFMDDYVKYINKFGWLFRSLPFIQNIYLCNSITFNALKEDSDIDLFIITKRQSLWRARFFSWILFSILGLKRSLTRKSKKFCLSFYITENADNLYNITLPQTDIYFSYWLAHLIPLYQTEQYNVYQHNQRLVSTLPNFPNQHVINIGTKLFKGKTRAKSIIEFLFGGLRGYLVEKAIKTLRLPIVISKTKKLKEEGRGIIINDNMLKFHLDVRKKVRLNYNLRKKGIHKTIYGIREE